MNYGTTEMPVMWAIIFGVLGACSVGSFVLKEHLMSARNRVLLEFFNQRLKAWWWFTAFFCLALWLGAWAFLFFWGIVSLQCLREYLSMINTRVSDHYALIWSFYIFLPLNFIFLGLGWEVAFMILIPIGAFLLLPMTAVLRGDTEQFLNRTAQIQWGLMICVYFLSYIPALALYSPEGFRTEGTVLTLFFLLFSKVAHICEFVWELWVTKILGAFQERIWTTRIQGAVAGGAGAVALCILLGWVLSFSLWQLWLVVLITLSVGYFGRMVLAAIRWSYGVSEGGGLNLQSVGMLGMMDTFCFTAPVFFYLCVFLDWL